jgi:hypothetical protein
MSATDARHQALIERAEALRNLPATRDVGLQPRRAGRRKTLGRDDPVDELSGP